MSGNYDGGSYVTHFLDSPITLYYTSYLFKLNPKSWHVKPCMRFELIACGKLYVVIRVAVGIELLIDLPWLSNSINYGQIDAFFN